MGIFVKSSNLRPLLTSALTDALSFVPPAGGGEPQALQADAAGRAGQVVQQLKTDIDWQKLLIAIAIAFVLLGIAIAINKWAPEISIRLMTSFEAYSGIVVGLLSGEVAASKV